MFDCMLFLAIRLWEMFDCMFNHFTVKPVLRSHIWNCCLLCIFEFLMVLWFFCYNICTTASNHFTVKPALRSHIWDKEKLAW